ncbi:hypothetical protein QC762_0045480 [Podospora pseudocomata]|uniref:Uncharacterized protein n=1 Tax=Podospora pseudocomata TaxID=2093779 RepID=A0ABR0GNT7_9PEZI|nr:hypothetical protein QC762_0045480 [Podospora pseudocomata]
MANGTNLKREKEEKAKLLPSESPCPSCVAAGAFSRARARAENKLHFLAFVYAPSHIAHTP